MAKETRDRNKSRTNVGSKEEMKERNDKGGKGDKQKQRRM